MLSATVSSNFEEQFTAAAAGGFAVDQMQPRALAAECDEF
jgi:hypothetical protein